MESGEGEGLLIIKEELRMEAEAGDMTAPVTTRHCGLCCGQ